MADLTAAIAEYFQQALETLELRIPVVHARLRAALHALGVVVEEAVVDETAWRIVVEVEPDQYNAIVQHPDFRAEMLVSSRPELDESKRLAGVA
jgi:hypothetical protein